MNYKKDACTSCNLNPDAKIKHLKENVADYQYVVAVAGNPNTGKSTIFNALTGLKQHTGNWSGKTISRAEGSFSFNENKYKLIDLPGTYSLLSTSQDEEIARNFILFSKPDVTLVVLDATRIERNLNLLLQILQITQRVVVCVNLLDEAQRNSIEIDLRTLSRKLGVPVVGTSARKRQGIEQLVQAIEQVAFGKYAVNPLKISTFSEEIQTKINQIKQQLNDDFPSLENKEWVALRLLEGDKEILTALKTGKLSEGVFTQEMASLLNEIRKNDKNSVHSQLLHGIYQQASEIAQRVVSSQNNSPKMDWSMRIDRIVTSKKWGFPIMFLILVLVLWVTIVGANYPSGLLNDFLIGFGHEFLKSTWQQWGWNAWFGGFLIDGIYLATAWVIAVMLPPMAIFFPIFTLLEDWGYLPRVAFNLDNLFRKAGAHGKQALTMTMGFGCNASGVVSTRIIDSPRERLIAIITNNFSLCNGRWPTQILLSSLFLGALVPSYLSGFVSLMAVAGIAVFGIGMMFFSSWFLSKTMLKGEVSSFHLELPPYRPPQFWQTLYTSLIDRTLIVLWRAIVFAIPAGAIIWLISNISVGDLSIAAHLVASLDGFGLFFGLNGVILLAYILAIPANEIVMPTILMLIAMVVNVPEVQASSGVLLEPDSVHLIGQMLRSNGWTTLTAVNVMIFSLLHNPCSTTIFTIYKETNSLKWTSVSVLLPLIFGFALIFIITRIWNFF